jgi:putative transposase
MKVHQAYRYELAPNIAQRIMLAKHAGASRFAYNWGLARRIERFETREGKEKFTSAMEQHKDLNVLKTTEYPWMYEVSKCAPQEALRDLERAFRNFWNGRKAGRGTGFPKFKKKGTNDSFRLTGSINVKDRRHIQLPRLGILKTKEKTDKFKGDILSATVRREADRWYVSLTVETERPHPVPVQGETVGIDVGLTTFLAQSDGKKIDAPKPLQKVLKRLVKAQRQHCKKAKGSSNRKSSAFRISRIHRKVRNIRSDFLHKTSTELAKTKSVIVIEDLNVKGMMQNRKLSRHIADVGWGELRRQLEYKAKWYGSKLLVAPRFFASSKTCSGCDYVMADMDLKVREWTCPDCSSLHDRDINAAQNLKKYHTGSSPEINACGDCSIGTKSNLC